MHEQQQAVRRNVVDGQEADARDDALWEAVEASPVVDKGPHIWVGTVDDYVRGRPHGRWISAAQPVARMERDIALMVNRAPSAKGRDEPSDWYVFSHAGFGRHAPSAGAPLTDIARRAEHYLEDARAYAAWAWIGGDDEAWLMRFPESYQGRFDRLQDWVTIQIEAAGYDQLLDRVVPDTIRPHVEINIDSLTHELRASGAVVTASDPERTGVFVFRLQ